MNDASGVNASGANASGANVSDVIENTANPATRRHRRRRFALPEGWEAT